MQREKDSMYGLTLVWALAAVYGQQEAPIIRISTLVHLLPLKCRLGWGVIPLLRCRAASRCIPASDGAALPR